MPGQPFDVSHKPTPEEIAALKVAHRAAVRATAVARGHVDHGDLQELQADHSDAEVEAWLAEHYRTPEGQREMTAAGKGGQDPAMLARLVMRGR